MFSKVKSVKKLNKRENCYDIQVEDSHCYYSNGILSHNSVAVVDSIVYALFGKTTKNLRTDEVVNNINECDCFVELSFNIRDDEYRILRYRKHTQFGNDLIIEKNNILMLNADNKRNVQKLIESIIKISFKSFILSIVLSSEKVANFAEVDQIERKCIIENLLMYDFISKYHRATKQILRKIKPQIEKLESRYNDKKETIKTLTNNLLKYIEKYENKIKEKQNRVDDLKNKNKKWKNINLAQEVENRRLLTKRQEELENIEDKIDDQNKYISEMKNKIYKLKKDKVVKQEETDSYLKNPESCPVCGNKIKDITFKKFIEEKQKEIIDIEKEINEIAIKEKEFTKKICRKEKRLLKKKEEIKELLLSITNELSNEDISNLQTKITSRESEIIVLQQQLEADIEEDEYVISTENKIDEIKNEIKFLKLQIGKLEEELIYYKWWKDALSNSPSSLKSFCINHILTSLNKYINYYLSFFKYDMSYSLDEDLNDNIIKDGKAITFAHLSRGEKRSVEITLLFALYEIIRLKMPDNINLIVLDELLSNFLDDIRVGGALSILQELETRGFDVFIIEHKEIIKDTLMCNTLNVTKDKKGFSTIF